MNRTTLLSLLLMLITAVPFGSLAAAEPTATPEPTTGVAGVISLSPARPGPIHQGESDARPLASIPFVVTKGEQQVATFETDAEGHFKVALPPGHYSVSRAGEKHRIGNYGPFEVDVSAGQLTHVEWKCDSGMR